jgi:drug/metabolite transporter (DMT)-like permease
MAALRPGIARVPTGGDPEHKHRHSTSVVEAKRLTATWGELAALMTAVCWSTTAVFFTFAGHRVGSVIVNRTRLIMALLLISLTHWILMGSLYPATAGSERWLWLGLSGVIGLALGDAFLFQSYLWVGPRLGMLMMSLAPVIAALLAFAFLGEQLSLLQWSGIIVTLAGIALVVLEGNRGAQMAPERRDYRRGILFGVGAASGQAIGLVLAKQGLQGDFSALSGNWIRMASAVVALWGVTLLSGRAGPTLRKLADEPQALWPIFGGAVTGPFIGVWLSLIAVQLTQVGVASTLIALPPVFLLPIGAVVFKEKVGLGAVAGTVVAMAGVALLFLA